MQSSEAYARRWLVLAVMATTLVMLNVDNTILNVALPSLVRDLHATTSQLQWIVDSYILVFGGLLLTGGSLGDRLGRKWIFIAGLSIFGLGSAVSAIASSADQLIFTRAFMGIGGAMAMPATLSIITDVFRVPRERAKAISIWAATAGIGLAIGPLAGGWLLSHFWWGSIFLVNVPIVGIGILASIFVVPNSKDEAISAPDPIGSLLSIATLGIGLWAIIEAPIKGWASSAVIGAGGLAIIGLVLFLYLESRSSHPMLKLEFFKKPRFSMAASAIAITFFSLAGGLFLITQYLQFLRGYSPLKAGVVLLPLAVGMIIFSPISAKVAHHIGTKIVVATGLIVTTIATLLVSRLNSTTGLAILLPEIGLFGVGLALTMPPSAESVMGSVPRNQAGIGSATNGTLIQVGGALGVAVLGSVLNTLYASGLYSHSLYRALPSGAAKIVKSSLGGAQYVVAKLPLSIRASLSHEANNAFIFAFSHTLPIASAVALLGSVLVVIFLPARNSSEHPPESFAIPGQQLERGKQI